jgi:CspA family cold shock protein
MEKGTIARLVDRGFGFIKQEGKDKDIFFHQSELQGVEFKDLKEGDEVEFEMGASDDKGPKAVKVSLVSKE